MFGSKTNSAIIRMQKKKNTCFVSGNINVSKISIVIMIVFEQNKKITVFK